MNREQTRQALECCAQKPRPDCNNCPMGEKRGCVISLIELALKHYTELIEEKEVVAKFATTTHMAEFIKLGLAVRFGTYTENDTVKIKDVFKFIDEIAEEVDNE